MAKSRKVGGATSSIEYAPHKIKKIRAAAARAERRWAAMAGPVTVREASPRRLSDDT
jgi:hypothetical protein